MVKTKFLASFLLALAMVVAQVGVATAQEATPITGTVQSITLDATAIPGTIIVIVTLDVNGITQTVRLSFETAASLDLVVDDGSENPAIIDSAIGTEISIDPADILPEPSPQVDKKLHPVGSALADFFLGLIGVDYDTIMMFHEDGVGFGVIAQAFWMTKKLGGDTSLFTAILDAKESKDYSGITLPNGVTPQNWGQFKKAVLHDDTHNSLGDIKAGKDNKPEKTGKPDKSDRQGKDKDIGKGNSR